MGLQRLRLNQYCGYQLHHPEEFLLDPVPLVLIKYDDLESSLHITLSLMLISFHKHCQQNVILGLN